MKKCKRLFALLLCGVLLLELPGCVEPAGAPADGSGVPSDAGAQPPAISVTEGDFSSAKEWDGAYDCAITLEGNRAQISGSGASLDGSVLKITQKGDYYLTGSFAGQVRIDSEDKVRLILAGVDIACVNSSAIYVASAKKAYITLAEGTQNTVTDGSEYIFADGEDEPNAAIFSHDDLIFDGTGSLTVNANYNNGIRSKDDLMFAGGSYVINAADNGISGKDSVSFADGSYKITAGGDAIRSTNDTDEGRGWISVSGGSFDITAGQDGLQACTTLAVSNGSFSIRALGGKGIKSEADMSLTGGALAVDSADDALHCGGSLEITGGELSLASGDDAIHADVGIVIGGDADVSITEANEGLEAMTVDITGGIITIMASDDGINAAGGNDSSAFDGPGGMGGGFGGWGGGGFGEGSADYYVSISGGSLEMNAGGDGIDSNGNVLVSGGSTVIYGPTNNGNSPVDYALEFTVTGGSFVAFGSAGMAANASRSSTQPVVLACFTGTAPADTEVSITAADGTVIYSGQPPKSFGCVIFTSPAMAVGENVTLSLGGEEAALSIDSTVTSYGNGGMGGPGGHAGGMGGGPGGGPGGGGWGGRR